MVHYRSLLIHSSIFLIFMQILASCAAASMAERLGDLALCPFEVKLDTDPTRIPKEIKQHSCKNKSGSRNTRDDAEMTRAEKALTCEDIGGHCVQVYETIKVSYRHRAMNHRKHDFQIDMSCVCVPLIGKTANPVYPEIER